MVGYRRVSRVLAGHRRDPVRRPPGPARDRRGARLEVEHLALLLRARPAAARRTSTSPSSPAAPSRSSAPPRPARARSPPCSPGWSTPTAAGSCSTASTCATSAAGQLAEVAAVVPQTAFLFDDDVRGNVTLGADVSDEEVWAALRAAQADGFVAALAARARHQAGRARHLALRRPAPADLAGPRAGPPPAAARPRRRHLGRRPRGRGADPRGARATQDDTTRRWSWSPTARPPSRWPTRWCTSRTAGSSTAAPTPSCWPAARPTPGWSTPTSTSSTPRATRVDDRRAGRGGRAR